ncbi:DUF2637 domain-containing protein, partial [Streptomyces justiciae]|uniref:DUF2637 domain-containing protein n=1 Tax=Streptomyces justiciae TaxID=2780140 RepID=UPI001D13C14E
FTGSYTAVRDLATDKGFGGFAYLFPIGIDAGICVLLALDLLLTHHRIPLPLLRHTAWLLTAATIAFNAASAWPDPLATGMHAVIPLLFITTIEAARHATGRLAKITAGTHMDSIRPARWLLAPLPTFLLWRRMKLWEQRSYTQALTLEQQRLLYQARLRSRYGRTWRHKAPIEALLPLRLTRYGIPLPHTPPSPTSLAPATGDPAAGVQPRPAPAAASEGRPRPRNNAYAETRLGRTQPSPPPPLITHAVIPTHTVRTQKSPTSKSQAEQLRAIYEAFSTRTASTPTYWAGRDRQDHHIPEPGRDTSTANHTPAAPETTHRSPASCSASLNAPHAMPAVEPDPHEEQDHGSAAPPERYHNLDCVPPDTAVPAPPHPEDDAASGTGDHPTASGSTTHHTATDSTPGRLTSPCPPTSAAPPPAQPPLAHGRRRPLTPLLLTPVDGTRADAPTDERNLQTGSRSLNSPHRPPSSSRLTLTDRYYLQWMNYQTQHGTEPTPEQLSTHLAAQGLLGRGNKPISPSNLRRHFLNWRIYNLWITHRTHHDTPSADDISRQCMAQHITGQYNRPITPTYITQHTPEFQRRWHTLTHHNARGQP